MYFCPLQNIPTFHLPDKIICVTILYESSQKNRKPVVRNGKNQLEKYKRNAFVLFKIFSPIFYTHFAVGRIL